MKLIENRPPVYYAESSNGDWRGSWVRLGDLARIFKKDARQLWKEFYHIYGGNPIPVIAANSGKLFEVDREGKIFDWETNEDTGYHVGEVMADGTILEWNNGENGIFCSDEWVDEIWAYGEDYKIIPRTEIWEGSDGQIVAVPADSSRIVEHSLICILKANGYGYKRSISSASFSKLIEECLSW